MGVAPSLPASIILMGPTAAGKTDLAIELAAEFPVEIVSVDSALVYRGLDIGTGKPSRELLNRVPHHLIDILEPNERYSAGQFVRDAQRIGTEIRSQGKVPLFVGGTMLYFKALTHGIADLPEANPGVRAVLNDRAARIGWPAMHAELASVDAPAAQKILPNDGQRIQRALEVYQLTGVSLSTLQREVRQTLNEDFLLLAWSPADRSALYDRIRLRFAHMIDSGFVDEVRQLYQRGDLSPELPSMRSVGYRQLWEHFEGRHTLDEAVELSVIATRHLARRQLIWLRAMPTIKWMNSLDVDATVHIKTEIKRHLAAML